MFAIPPVNIIFDRFIHACVSKFSFKVELDALIIIGTVVSITTDLFKLLTQLYLTNYDAERDK